LQIPSARGVMQVKEGTSGSRVRLAQSSPGRQKSLRFWTKSPHRSEAVAS